MSILGRTKENRFLHALVVFCAFLFGTAGPVLAQSLSFSSVNLGTGNGPLCVMPVDINGNGFPGVVTANFGFRYGYGPGTGGGAGSTLTVFTNDGYGELTSNATLNVELEPASIAVADVNGDGALDLICANVGSSSLTVLTNNRQGGFVLEGSFPVGSAPVSVAVADVNGDGYVDLISANWTNSTLTVLTNNGHGSFKLSATIQAGHYPSCVVAADINGDGSVDLICANSGDNVLQTFTNNGRGVFTSSAKINVANGVGLFIGADVNGDGSVDLVAANTNTTLSVFTNNGRGTFSLQSTPSTLPNCSTVQAADMNGDGKVDLICVINNNGIQGAVEVFTNDGVGNFSSNTVVPVGIPEAGNYPSFVAVADFNGDGNNDLAVSCYGTALITELPQINGPPHPIVTITSPANDAVIPNNESFAIDISAVPVSTNQIKVVLYYVDSILFGSTNAPFDVQIPAGAIPAGTHALQAYVFDSGGDSGWSAEVQINVTTATTHIGPGKNPLTFSSSTLATGSGPYFVLPVDLTGNGHVDLVTANYGYYDPLFYCVGTYAGGDSNLTVWNNNGQGAFSSSYTTLTGITNVPNEPSCVAAADLNGDGHLELISTDHYINLLSILTNNGKGVFEQEGAVRTSNVGGPDARGPIYVAIADVNGDGKPDLITVNNYDSNLSVLTNAGDFSFPLDAALPVGPGPTWVAAADINGDGSIDLVCANYGTCGEGNTLTVYTNDGRGDFTSNATITVGSGPICVVAADVNGDGFVDLITANNYDYSLSVLTNDGHGNFTLKSMFNALSPSAIVATDLNGDGYIDLAVANNGISTRGSVTIYLNDGEGNFTSNTLVQVGNPDVANYPNSIAAADFNGNGKVDLVVANLGSASLTVLTQTTTQQKPPPPPPTPVVSITSPTNAQFFPTNQSFVITASATPVSAVSGVGFFLDGGLLGTSMGAPYEIQVPAGSIAPGGHSLQAVAVNSVGVSATSAVVQITLNIPGTALIDFDPLNTSAGAVGGTLLANYLARYGVTLANVTVGTAMEAVDTNSLTGNVEVEAPSSPNIFTQAGLNQPVSFTLLFATNLQAFGFTRAGLFASSGLASHPQWTATTFNSAGTPLSSVTEGLILSARPVAERSFVLTGNGIASVRFDSDSQQTAAFSAVLLDNLVLDYNSVTPALSVNLSVASPPTNDIVAPATITLNANVSDLLGPSYYVSFFAGATLLGTVSNSPYQLTLNNVLPGNYSLQARAVDSSGVTAISSVVLITVQIEPNSTAIDFDTLITKTAPVETAAVEKYLAGFGVTVASLSPGTELTVESQQQIAGGNAVSAASPPNLLTQTGSNGPVQFTLRFATLLSQFGFTRPELLANPFVSHPAWQATAFDGSGAIVGQVGEAEIESSTNVGAQEFSLVEATGPAVSNVEEGPGIAAVEFASEGTGLTTFNGMLIDNLVLTTNKSGFPPAVAITAPASGLVLARPPSLTVTAAAYDATGIASVSFYVDGSLLGTDTTSPYTVQWVSPRPGNHALTAVASNVLGLTWTSSVVNIDILPSASLFGISSQPASQTVAVGGSATFSVVTTGTNVVTYQWSHDGVPIPGATSATYVLIPPIFIRNEGTYTVAVTAQGVTNVSAPAVLTVVAPPTIATEPEGTNAPAGTDVSLSVVAAGNGPFTYQWLLNANSIPGATDSSYVIQAAQPRQSGNYQVVVADLAASALSTVAPVIVETAMTVPETNDTFADRASINPLLGPVSDSNLLAVVQKGAPLPDGLPGGNSIWFTWRATFTGTVSLTTQGSDFESVMAVYTGTELSNLKVVAADDGSGGYLTSLVTFNVVSNTEYQIAVDGYQSGSGRVVLGLPAGTGYRVLNPSTGDSVPVIVKGPASQEAAPGAAVSLSVQATSSLKMSYQWYFQGTPISGATGSTLGISHLQPGSVGLYYVLVANAVGSAQSEPASLQIEANLGGKAVSTGSKFVNTTNANSPAALATDIRSFDLGGDTGGFSASQVFSTVGATTEPGEPQPCGQVGAGSEWFVYTAPVAGMLQVNTDGSTFNTLLGIYTGTGESFASLDEVGCGYSTNYLTQGQPSVVIPNVAKGTVFFILIEGFQGATGIAQLQIGLGQPLTFRSLPSGQLVTAGNEATFEATAIGSTPLSYQWQLNGANVPGATKSTYTVANAQGDAVGNYTVIASNIVGVVTSSPPAELNVQFAPAIVAGPSNETVTLGQSAKFAVEALGVNVKTNPFVCQWYFDGALLSKATSLSLTIPGTRWTNNGSYDLVISNTYGAVTSAVAMLTVLDKIPPTVVIKTPAANSVTNARVVTVSGTAADNVGVAQVQVEVNSNGFQPASGTTNWSRAVTLVPGANVISAYSVDLAGNLSTAAKRTVAYDSSATLPAEPESLRQPADRSLSPAAGTYCGLFYPAAGATRASAGFFTATVSSVAAGAFSANILLDGGSYPFAGKFDPSGDAQAIVPRAGKTSVTASLHLDLDLSAGQMTGVISSADWRSILQAGRAVFDAATNPAPLWAGQFALVIPSGAIEPAGYLAITNTAGGTALVTGTLADGANIFRAAPMAKGPLIPLYAPLYSGQGMFLAWITFTNSTAPANFGPAVWIGPGFTNLTDVIIVK
jgi:hypothetical protein